MQLPVVRIALLHLAAAVFAVVGLQHQPLQANILAKVGGNATLSARNTTGTHPFLPKFDPWTDSGGAVATGLTTAQLSASVGGITADNYGAEQRKFAELATSRFIIAPGNGRAAAQLRSDFSSLGFAVREQPVRKWTPYGVPEAGNVIGFLEGGDLAHEVVILGAHYDSVNWDNTGAAAPGADDDASGVAALLQAARAIALEAGRQPGVVRGGSRGGRLRRSVLLVAFQAEEVGLVGSEAFVHEVILKGDYGTPVAVVIADMISFPGRGRLARRAVFDTRGRTPGNMALLDTMAHQAMADGSLAGFDVDYNGGGSDNRPFLEAGYPSVLLIERDYMYYTYHLAHSTKDVMQNTDPGFGAAMTRLAVRTILAYGSPLRG